MAFMCADSGNLTAIAKQVIQQQQQQQQRQQLHNHQNQQLLLVQDKQILFGEQQQLLLPDESDYFAAATLPAPWIAAHDVEDPQHDAAFFYPDSIPAFSSAFPDLAPPPLPPRADFEAYQWVDSLAEASEVAGDAWCTAGATGSDLAEIFSSCLSSSDELYRVLISEPPESPKVAAAAVHVDTNMSPSPPPSLPQEAWSVIPAGSPRQHQSPNHKDEVPVSATPQSCHQLLRSLVDCARLVDSEPDLSAKSLIRIMDSALELGDPAERVAFYASRALYRSLAAAKPRSSSPSRLSPKLSPLNASSAWSDDYALHYRAFYDACPYAKFADITANQAILEAIDSAAHIHVVDFGITHGVQWAALLQDLATRPSGKPTSIRISAVPAPGFPHSGLAETGARLRDFAAGLGLELRVNPVLVDPLQTTASSFRVDPAETLAVNFMLQVGCFLGGAESPAGVERMLRLAKSLRPKVITLAEHEVSVAGGVARRVGAAVGFYASVFESLEPAMTRDSPERAGIERAILGPGLAAVVEGKHGMADKGEWLGLMERCGFQAVPPSSYAVSQANLLLWNYNYSTRYSLVESPPAFLSIAWDERPILTVSSWR